MTPTLRGDDTCCLCQKPAANVLMTTIVYMGRSVPVAAAICDICYGRIDRDEILRAYIEIQFTPKIIQ